MSDPTGHATAPPCGGTVTLQETLPDPVGRATSPPSGRIETLQHYFPVSYKKKARSKKTALTQ